MNRLKLLYICPSIYMDGYGYQERFLTIENHNDGHEVLIVASTYVYKENDNEVLHYISPCQYMNLDGIQVVRKEYVSFFSPVITEKVRKLSGLCEIVEEFVPDVIFFEGTSSVDIGTVVNYKRLHSNVKFYICSHTDFYTSGRNWLSRKILHGMFYKYYLHKAMPYVDKYFYITWSCKEFYKTIYNIPEEKMECLPLGGIIPDKKDLEKDRLKLEQEYNLPKDSIVFLQAGKMDRHKRLLEMLRIFMQVKNDRFVFVVVGTLSGDVREEAVRLIEQDSRIHYIGWQETEALNSYLNACDVYLQPGKVSATLQNAICRGCVIVSNFFVDYQPYVTNNGWLVKDISEIQTILQCISDGTVNIEVMKRNSMEIAREFLDYRKIARRLYADCIP